MPALITPLGDILYNERENSREFLGLRYGKAKRFEYATLVDSYDGIYDATTPKDSFMQKRNFPKYEHLEIPARKFYHREFRENINFHYSEDAFFLNIWAPKDNEIHPVMIFIHGGGFDSGSISESPFDGDKLAGLGIVVVTIQYRVGPLGYMTHEGLTKKNGRDGSFGLDDQVKAITWVKNHINHFGGNKEQITLCGQSAGAMSIQFLCVSEKTKGLFQRAIMLSGGGLWPKMAQPLKAEDSHEYWNQLIELSIAKSFDEFIELSPDDIYKAFEEMKSIRKDNAVHMMPVIDGYYLTNTMDNLMKKPHTIDYMIGFTNNDMYTIVLKHMAKKFRNQVNGYLYYFDIDAKGDNNQAFHSSELRYLFGTLDKSWRPYDEKDYQQSGLIMEYISQFVKTGNPNKDGLPSWEKTNKAMHFTVTDEVKMVKPKNWKLIKNTFKGDPS